MSLPIRKKLRLENYDYSTDGYYFVTICTKDKRKLFGEIPFPESNYVHLTTQGKITEKHILEIGKHFSNVKIDKYVVMPNHVHMIVIIGCQNTGNENDNPSLSNVIGLFKSGVSRELGQQVWQTRFHDHVIRNEIGYLKIWNYIDTNPILWKKDMFFT